MHVYFLTTSLTFTSSHLCSLLRLSKQFELPEATVHSIISKMIIKEELLVGVGRWGRGRG